MNDKFMTATMGLALVAAANLEASIIGVSSSGALGANDYVSWSPLGVTGTVVPAPSTDLSANGLVMTISSTGGDMERLDQGNGWGGNFAPGAALLWNHGNGAISISFATGVYGVGAGAQVQADYFGPFTGTVSAYGAANNLLGTYDFGGNSTGAGDNSAVFAGIMSSAANIYQITFDVTDINLTQDFAMSQLDLLTGPPIPVPERMAMISDAMLLLPVVAIALRQIRKKLQPA